MKVLKNINKSNKKSLYYWQFCLILILFCYLFIGISLELITKRSEIFPVFSWFLFAKVPPETITRYNIIIHQYNEQDFKPGISFYQADQTMVTKNNVVANTLITKMGNAHGKNEQEEFKKLRNVFEGSFLRGKIKYELVKEEYSLLDQQRTGTINQTSLGFFSN